MEAKIAFLWPEIALFITTCLAMIFGVSPNRSTRALLAPVSILGLLIAGYLAYTTTPQARTPLPALPMYGKLLVAAVGLVLILLLSGTVDRDLESDADRGRPFDSARSTRGEFYAFTLFSLTGLMLCAGADDLIFLFLALELTSLPTYVMVSLSTARNRSMEAGVKYFFLGALGAAIFLFGFTLIYGGTASTNFASIAATLAEQSSHGWMNPIALAGLVIAILGICFKIAAVPMHFYTPDVYQGAAAPVGAFLAFVPKAAGFFAIMLLTSLVGWNAGGLPESLRITLWVVAASTMTVGNVLAILQPSVKRLLAYSSIAHSGYMLVGIIAGPGPAGAGFSRNGLAAVLFYLLAYGVTTAGTFAVLACLERRTADGSVEEADGFDDIKGLIHTSPMLGWTMVLSSVGLLGLPPLVGFLGKLPLFTSAIGAGEIPLVIVLAINSAIAAYYYLRLAYVAFIEPPQTAPNAPKFNAAPFPSRLAAAALSMAGVVGLAIVAGALGNMATIGGSYIAPRAAKNTPAHAAAEVSSSPSTH